MIQIKFWFIALLIFSTFKISAQGIREKEITGLLQTQQACWNKGDIPCFMDHYFKDESLKFVGKKGVTYGWNNTMNNYLKGYPDTASMGKLDFTILHIDKLSSKYYAVTGKWQLRRSIGDIGGYFTLLLRKIKGRWMIIYDHTS